MPPLNALRAFEAAARHLSFTKAAEELRVSQSAISQQVRKLESRLGVRVFLRGSTGLELTGEGRTYLAILSEALDRVDAATAEIFGSPARTVLTVGAMATLALKWLLPRLPRFRRDHPDVQVNIASAPYVADYDQVSVWRGLGKDIDLAFHDSEGPWPGLRSWWLMDSDLLPVCSPELRDGSRPLRRPADLDRFELLQVNVPQRQNDWQRWLQVAGVSGLKLEHAHRFDYSYLAIQAAIEGLGVAVTNRPFVSMDLTAGRLVAPFEIAAPAPHSYYLVCAEADAGKPKIAAFREWVLREAALERAAPAVNIS
ncbi:MAG: transcriptional regulator GcvA [Alphaproteobacteria bacterium]|nr:transcriptional regulator GcvA [Alphaproteobacteria bacterium]